MNESESPVSTNNFEDYLSYLCGVQGELPVPRSRADIYLKYLCEHQTQGKTFVVGWKKGTTPDVTKIPAGITVTYEGQSYTGTLAASEQTAAGLYLVYNGNSTEGGIDYYDEYGTVQNADETYSWERIGGGDASSWDDVKNKPFESVGSNLLVADGVLKVDTTDNAEEDNTRPITSAGTYTIVGNINTLLSLI